MVSAELAGAVAIVTGAAGGVGRATAELLTARGARVVAEDVNPAVKELESEQVVALRGDVARPDTARRAVALAHERSGALDVVVNNAGRFLLKPTLEPPTESAHHHRSDPDGRRRLHRAMMRRSESPDSEERDVR